MDSPYALRTPFSHLATTGTPRFEDFDEANLSSSCAYSQDGRGGGCRAGFSSFSGAAVLATGGGSIEEEDTPAVMVVAPHVIPTSALAGKRKLKDVEFEVLDRDDVEKQEAEQYARRRADLERFNPTAFAAQARILLLDLKTLLGGPFPSTLAEVQALLEKTETCLDRLSNLAKIPGASGQVAGDIILLLREEVLEKQHGLDAWIIQTKAELEDYDGLSLEDKGCFHSYMGQELEDFESQLEFCLEQLADIESPEGDDE